MTNHIATTTEFYVVADVPSNTGCVVELNPEDAWGNENPSGWTFQGISNANGGTCIMEPHATYEDAEKELHRIVEF